MKNNLTKTSAEDFIKSFFDLPIINHSNILKTNIRKEGSSYVYEIDVPGYSKDNININYEDGYLIVEAKVTNELSRGSENYISQERYSGTCSRSYYVGEIEESKINAKYSNGILFITIPDKQKENRYSSKRISIE